MNELANNEDVKNVWDEYPVDIPDLNVKGRADLVVELNTGEIYLYDFKTIGSWSWRYKFGKKKEENPSFHHEIQLATYGYGLIEEFGRLDGMYIIYYNKDSSVTRQLEVSMDFIDMAYNFWTHTIETHKSGLPSLLDGESPVAQWECRYCNLKEICDGR